MASITQSPTCYIMEKESINNTTTNSPTLKNVVIENDKFSPSSSIQSNSSEQLSLPSTSHEEKENISEIDEENLAEEGTSEEIVSDEALKFMMEKIEQPPPIILSPSSDSSSEKDEESHIPELSLNSFIARYWSNSKDLENVALQRRLRDFRFAQTRRRDTHGESRPWGIIGLYEHLNAIRYDLEWAEDAAWRRQNNEP